MSNPDLLTVADGIARITLDRPERRNAIDAETHRQLRAALDRIESDPDIRVTVLSGAGGTFCSGQDLAERAAMLKKGEVDLAKSLEENYNPLVRRLARLPMPVVAVVRGVAAGAGAALALSADIVLASRSARFQLAFARVALGPDSGASWLFQRQVGQARAMGMALTAEAIDAERAENWGLIWRCVDDEALDAEAEALVQQLKAGPRAALQAIKRRLREAADETLEQALDAERNTQGILGADPDYREAVTAFIEKRKPRFR